ncbi:putative oxidoreductase [Sphingobium xanthum]|jgi:putative oxidoreductase|uniref:DoxX family protein n=1 Tax=Sphingobium xanthum TaxID=1387165 RepID=UPI001C8CD394|nr:DoxX family protein [Sphingobium xanthum]
MALDPQDLLRIMCGAWFLPHAALKLKNATLAQHTFSNVGLNPGWAFLALTIVMELIAAAGLILNIYPQPAAALAVFVLMGATYAVLRMHGWNWRWNKNGPEYMIFWSLACILAVI